MLAAVESKLIPLTVPTAAVGANKYKRSEVFVPLDGVEALCSVTNSPAWTLPAPVLAFLNVIHPASPTPAAERDVSTICSPVAAFVDVMLSAVDPLTVSEVNVPTVVRLVREVLAARSELESSDVESVPSAALWTKPADERVLSLIVPEDTRPVAPVMAPAPEIAMFGVSR